jgi:hypothetical protein
MGIEHRERRERALAAAQAIAGRYGLDAGRPRVLQDSNHTVIHLAPAPIVAKVNTSPEEANLAGEVEIAWFLASQGAPVVLPASLLPPGPHVEGGLEVTFWEYCVHEPGEPSLEMLGRSLRALHDVLASYPAPLRAWDRFDGVERVLGDEHALTALDVSDRGFLRSRYRRLRAAIDGFQPPLRPLHGEPHSGNLLLSSQGPRWIDFESACLGPQEWDLTVLPDEIVDRYFSGVDWELLGVLRAMRSLVVAVWCWLDPDRAPVLRQAGTYHLALLRTSSQNWRVP